MPCHLLQRGTGCRSSIGIIEHVRGQSEQGMKLYQRFKGQDAIEFCRLNLSLPPHVASQSIVCIETYTVFVPENGEDFCEIHVINADQEVVHIDRVFS